MSSHEGYLFGLEAGERDLVLELVDDAVAVKVVDHALPIGTVEVVVEVEIATIVEGVKGNSRLEHLPATQRDLSQRRRVSSLLPYVGAYDQPSPGGYSPGGHQKRPDPT